MLRIRLIRDTRSPANRTAIEEAQRILREQFPGIAKEDIDKLPEQLENPLKFRFVTELLVSEDAHGHVRGVAVLLFATDLGFAYLDVISAAPKGSGRGWGAVLYERVREDAAAHGAKGLYFECLPDDPALSPRPEVRKQNEARLRFYERYGAYPITGTAYETPIKPGDTDSPYLVFDGLGKYDLPEAKVLQGIVRAILERKYGSVCPPEYTAKVVESIRPNGFDLRAPRYVRAPLRREIAELGSGVPIPLVVNDKHEIHHIRERGYVEAPVRISAILGELEKSGLFERRPAKRFPDRHVREVHDGGLIDFIERTSAETPAKKSIYPYVFPIRNATRRPSDRSVLAGYWCIDTFTPINRNAYPAARGAVDCALTAAETVLNGARLAYALVRPPGHHAERRAFGGFCYFNNSAIAAHYLSAYGRVAVFDIDYHHGNGTQDIFYERNDVLTVSIHGHPRFAYPYFTGFRDEKGRGPGAGYNLNLPLAETITPDDHRAAVETALRRIRRHNPAYLVMAVGFDTAKGDPTGTWSNAAADFHEIGRMIGEIGFPTIVVQEGGYRVRTLGINARHFFQGLVAGQGQTPATASTKAVPGRKVEPAAIFWRESVNEGDLRAIERLVAGTEMFTTDEVGIAKELVEERIARGRASGYSFILAERNGRLQGYACYGPAAGTDGGFDLYWIVVAPEAQRQGLGRELQDRVEAAVRNAGGDRLYIDTSSTEKYAPTRAYYRRAGFRKVADIPDFYRPGDGKIVMVKTLV